MNTKQFMPELDPRERAMVLQQNSDKMEHTTYQKPLSEDELNARREVLAENCIKLADLEDQKKEAMAEFKEKIDPVKGENMILLDEIRTKQTKVDGVLYHMANHNDGMMETYDHDGYLVSSRRLRPDEKQQRIPLAVAK